MAVTVTNTTVTALNADQTLTANAATSTVVNGTEVFTITPTKGGHKNNLIFSNGTGHGAFTYSIAAGDQWSAGAITGSIAAGALEVLDFDSAKVLKNGGTIAITLTPASGKILLTNHAAKVYFLENL